jgi:hypothetical protein
MIATIVLAAIGALLAAGLLVTFAASYRKVRAPFTLGLVMVAAFFMAQNLLILYAFLTMMADISSGLAPYLAGIMAFGDVALGTLLYASYQ